MITIEGKVVQKLENPPGYEPRNRRTAEKIANTPQRTLIRSKLRLILSKVASKIFRGVRKRRYLWPKIKCIFY